MRTLKLGICGYELRTADLFSSTRRNGSGFKQYRDAIVNQLKTDELKQLLLGCFLKLQRSSRSQSPRPDLVSICVSIEIAAKGSTRLGVVKVKEAYSRLFDERQIPGVRATRSPRNEGDLQQVGSFNEWRTKLNKNWPGYSSVGLTVDFSVHYPKHTVCFGVHVELPFLESEFERFERELMSPGVPLGVTSWEREIVDALGDTAKLWEIRQWLADIPRPNSSNPSSSSLESLGRRLSNSNSPRRSPSTPRLIPPTTPYLIPPTPRILTSPLPQIHYPPTSDHSSPALGFLAQPPLNNPLHLQKWYSPAPHDSSPPSVYLTPPYPYPLNPQLGFYYHYGLVDPISHDVRAHSVPARSSSVSHNGTRGLSAPDLGDNSCHRPAVPLQGHRTDRSRSPGYGHAEDDSVFHRKWNFCGCVIS